ncbi:MAG: adenylate/guanylate cyclase domain-containing protein [Bacteroidota bacterium]
MSNIHTNIDFQYENLWLAFLRPSDEEQLLVKHIKSNASSLVTNWEQESARLETFNHLPILWPTTFDADTTKKYALPSGRLLLNVIESNDTTLAERLTIADQLIRIVSNINDKNVFFCDLNWHLFWYDLLQEQLSLLDILMTIDLSATATYRSNWHTEANRYCIAPEQSLVNSYQPDVRSNYYSLGIILYALFTGQRPFEGEERLSVLHKHLSVDPIAPHHLQPNLGINLSRFLLKLLAKNPEERYQSSKGLLWDFQQIKNLLLDGISEELTLGTRDFPAQFILPDSIFIRNTDRRKLDAAATQTAQTRKTLFLLKGDKGVGIDALMENFVRELDIEQFYAGKGRFVTNKNLPYSGIKQMTADLIHRMQTQVPEDRRPIQRDLDQRIGNLSGVLIAFERSFRELFSSVQAAPEVRESSVFNRLAYAYIEFLKVLELQGKTVVLCIEDVHLADRTSLRLLEEVLKTSVLQQVLLVMGYGDESTRWSDHFTDFFSHIQQAPANQYERLEHRIHNLSKTELKTILQQLKIEPLLPVKRMLHQKTNGHVDFIKQLFSALTTNNLIEPNVTQQNWMVNAAAIEGIHISENVNDFLKARIRILSEDALHILKIAAAIGESFKLKQLQRMSPFEADRTDQLIEQLRTADFLLPLSYKRAQLHELQFAHADFQPTLQTVTSIEEYEAIKLSLLEDITASIAADSNHTRLYELVDHLAAISPEKRAPYQAYLQQTALKAKRETAFEAAAQCFEMLFEVESLPYRKDPILLFDYLYEACNCRLFEMNYPRYEALLQKLSAYAVHDFQRHRIYILKADAYTQLEQFEETIDNLAEGLEDMGISFSTKINKRDQISIFIQNMWRTRKMNKESVLHLPLNQDEQSDTAQSLILKSSAAIYFLNPALTSRLTRIGIANLTQKGLLPSSPGHIVSTGFIINSFSDLVGKAESLAQAGLALLKTRLGDANGNLYAHFMYGTFIQHASHPLADSIQLLQQYYKKGRECGNISIAFYCLGMNRWYQIFDGRPLSELKESLSASHRMVIDNNRRVVSETHHKIMKSLVSELTSETLSDLLFADTSLLIHDIDLSKADGTISANVDLSRMILSVANGQLLKDKNLSTTINDYLSGAGHGTYNAIVIIFYSLFHYFKTDFYDAHFSKKFIQKQLKVLATRSQSAPQNHMAKYELLNALKANKAGKIQKASAHFQEAYCAAIEYDNNWDKGLVLEEYSQFLLAQQHSKLGMKIMAEAVAAYRDWGATSIVNRLLNNFPELNRDENASFLSTQSVKQQEAALSIVFEWGKRIRKEDQLDAQAKVLLNALEAIVYTERAVFLINMEGQFNVYATKEQKQPPTIINDKASTLHIPLSLLQLVKRRRTEIRLEEVTQSPQFANDPYIRRNNIKSILCLPFVKGNEITSILYLENSQSNQVFDVQQTDLVKLLFYQVATLLDQAALTELLEEKLKLRAQQIQLERDKSNELLSNILPRKVAEELKENGQVTPKKHENVSVLFTDFKDFSKFSNSLTADQLIGGLNECYRAFDEIVEAHGLEKIKTIGDSYMCASGIPEAQEQSTIQAVKAALDMLAFIDQFNEKRVRQGLPAMQMRAGIHTGSVVAGVVGIRKYAYDIWGSTVNIASRMESAGEAGQLNISGSTYLKVKNHYDCIYRGKIEAKNIGEIDMYFVSSKDQN